MAQEQGEYRVGRGQPPLHTRFPKGRSGNPKGPRKEDLPALLQAAWNEPVTVDRDGRPRRISKREAIVAGLVDKSADADRDELPRQESKKGAGDPAAPRRPRRLEQFRPASNPRGKSPNGRACCPSPPEQVRGRLSSPDHPRVVPRSLDEIFGNEPVGDVDQLRRRDIIKGGGRKYDANLVRRIA